MQCEQAAQAIEVLYADDALAVCLKPAGADSERELPALLGKQLGGTFFCVHRLDRPVGGVTVCARTPSSAAALSRAVSEWAVEKTYLAVCEGVPEPAEGELSDLLFHDAKHNKTFVVTRQRKGVKEAVLRYEVMEAHISRSLLRIRLLTGRSHQIRVQLASRGMPLLGDARYGSKVKGCGLALWSAELAFPHPLTGEKLRFFVAPPRIVPWTDFSAGGADDAKL